jgi:hypothetical protein
MYILCTYVSRADFRRKDGTLHLCMVLEQFDWTGWTICLDGHGHKRQSDYYQLFRNCTIDRSPDGHYTAVLFSSLHLFT